jgi:hypothetical protein
MERLSLIAAAALIVAAGAAHGASIPTTCSLITGAVPANTLNDGYCAGPGNVAVSWLQGPDNHEFNENLAAFDAPTGFTPGYIELLDPGTGAVSDVLLLGLSSSDPGHVDVAMMSSGDTSIEVVDFNKLAASDGSPPLLATLTETGNWQNVSSYFGMGADTVYVTSFPLPIPEPAAWAMMLAGFGMAGACLRHRVRATTAA